jgi:hypothetical protein
MGAAEIRTSVREETVDIDTIRKRLDSGYYDQNHKAVEDAILGGILRDLSEPPPRPSYVLIWILGAAAIGLATLAYFLLRG